MTEENTAGEILFIAFLCEMLYCIGVYSFFPAGNPLFIKGEGNERISEYSGNLWQLRLWR